ncbi:hypothetical protein QQ045_006747 [Rhodiola kirilowii]
MLRQQWLAERYGETSSGVKNHQSNPTEDIIRDAFPFQFMQHEDLQMNMDTESGDVDSRVVFERYTSLVGEAQTPLYTGCNRTILETILRAMQVKVESGLSDKGFNKILHITKEILPLDNNNPSCYKDVKKVLKNMGLGYETIHACEHGCILYYKEHKDRITCPVCGEGRYRENDRKSKVPKKTLKYFPLTPRLQRLFMSPDIAGQMRWHASRIVDDLEYIRHPGDCESWQLFDKEYPKFSSEIRNVRLGLATDGFNPFGSSGLSHSTWPVVVIPYNLPPHMCMRKEFNILCMLISGPKSPGKCLSVFMRPLIDELKVLWNEGVCIFDRRDQSSFIMKAAVISTISDFPGLGMLGGLKTKGWLPRDHAWRFAPHRFNGKIERRDPPPPLVGHDVFNVIMSHEYPTLSLHPRFKARGSSERLCWTHVSIFYELPYWKSFSHPYSLDVMHIEKNVFDNIIGTILVLEGKTKDDIKARKGLEEQGVRRKLWFKPSGSNSRNKEKVTKAPYIVTSNEKLEILEYIKDAKYPSGYAGSLKNKINLEDKKFIGFKTHDCHVMLQRLLPVYIRPYLPRNVVHALISLSHWFRRICCREIKKDDVRHMKLEIVQILCQLERIFPPAFFTIMVHLMVHLPDQILFKGPVHYSWMYPIERQLGKYKKFVRNTRYPEGCIAEDFTAHECVMYCKLYMGEIEGKSQIDEEDYFNISVVSNVIKPTGCCDRRFRLNNNNIDVIHWCVMENCEEAREYIIEHAQDFYSDNPDGDNDSRIEHFHPYLLNKYKL